MNSLSVAQERIGHGVWIAGRYLKLGDKNSGLLLVLSPFRIPKQFIRIHSSPLGCDPCIKALAGSFVASLEKHRLLRVGNRLLPSPLLKLPFILMISDSQSVPEMPMAAARYCHAYSASKSFSERMYCWIFGSFIFSLKYSLSKRGLCSSHFSLKVNVLSSTSNVIGSGASIIVKIRVAMKLEKD
jgi:hypothetical protein